MKENCFVTKHRMSLTADTLRSYLFVRTNMPPLENWDPRAAIKHWFREKNRRPNQFCPKTFDQKYFKGIVF